MINAAVLALPAAGSLAPTRRRTDSDLRLRWGLTDAFLEGSHKVDDLPLGALFSSGARIDRVLTDARTIIADRRRRLRCTEAVTVQGGMCDACDPAAVLFCAVGALINSAHRVTGDHEHENRLGWKVAGLIARAARLRPVDEGGAGWSLALLSDTRGQAAVLRAVDTLIEQRRA